MDFSHLYFRNAASFKSLPIIESIAEAAKIFEFTSVIPDKSILLVSNYENEGSLLAVGENDKVFFELLSCGTKPIDALVFLNVAMMTDSEDKTELKRKFRYEKALGYIDGAFEESCAAITAAYMIAVTRGSLPGSSMSSANNPLPTLIRNMFKDAPTNEMGLASMAMSFDPKHISLGNLFVESSLLGWPEEVANRMNLGVAGHKIMKACQMLKNKFQEADSKARQICLMLASLADESNGGFYPNLHPSNNAIKATHPKFYSQGLKALFDCLKGTKDEKYADLEMTGSFKSESLIINKKLDKIPMIYSSWDAVILKGLIGQPAKFVSYDVDQFERLELIKRSDYPVIIRTKVNSESDSDGESGEVIIHAGGESKPKTEKSSQSATTQTSTSLSDTASGTMKPETSKKEKKGKGGEKISWLASKK